MSSQDAIANRGRSIVATIAAWLIAALCIGLCIAALALWQTDLAIRRRLPDMGYNEILKLRDDVWRPFRAPLAWGFIAIGIGAAATSCIPGLIVRRPIVWVPVAIAAVASLGALSYLVATR